MSSNPSYSSHSRSPSVVFVPGAWHRPSCYNLVIALLEHPPNSSPPTRCVKLQLATTGDNREATFKDDVDATQSAIENEVTQGRDVVVVVHSYGGMVGSSAIKGFTRRSYMSETAPPVLRGEVGLASEGGLGVGNVDNRRGAVIGIVMIATGFTITGVAMMDPFFGHPPPQWVANQDTGFAQLVNDPRDMFYHDIPAEDAEQWVGRLTNQSLKGLFEGREYAYSGWRDVPVYYIGTIEDRGMPVTAQRLNVAMAREMGGDVKYYELRTSHSPSISQPQSVVDIIMKAIDDFVSNSISGSEKEAVAVGVVQAEGASAARATTSIKSEIVVEPSARLLSPSTWLRYGLPFALGRFVGRSMLVYSGLRRFWRTVFGT